MLEVQPTWDDWYTRIYGISLHTDLLRAQPEASPARTEAMMDNPDIFLNICRTCTGSGEIGLGFWQECPVCSGTGTTTPPSDDELRAVTDDQPGREQGK